MEKGRLKKLVVPIALEQLLTVCVGFADTFMVTKVSEAAVSGVALVNTINVLVMQIMVAFATGGVVVISQYIGENNEKKTNSATWHLQVLMGVFSLLVSVLFLVFRKGLLHVLFGAVDSDVMEAAVTYLTITAISFLFYGFFSEGSAILRCHEDTKTSMNVSIVMNVLNVGLNALFLFGMHLGVAGVALATLISRMFAGVIMKIIITKRIKTGEKTQKSDWLSWNMMNRILRMGVPSGIENGMFHVGKLILTGLIAKLGTTAIAANTIAYQIIEFPDILGVSIGLALVVIVGQDIGAGSPDMAKQNTAQIVKLTYLCNWGCKAILFAIVPYVVALFSLSEEGCSLAVELLRWYCVASIFAWPLSYALPNAFRGAGDVKYSMIVSVISMWLGRVVVSYILIVPLQMGVLGLWLGMFVDWHIRAVGYLMRFLSGKWLTKKII